MGRRRKHGIIDNLDPAVKSTVEEMILSAQFTYRDIVEYITDTTGQSISQAAVCRYAKGFCEDAAAIHMAQENFRAIAEMCGKYPDLDTTEGIVQLMSSLVMTSVRNLSPEDLDGTDPLKLIKQASELVRAVSYKRSMDIKTRSLPRRDLMPPRKSCLRDWQAMTLSCTDSLQITSKARKAS